MFKETTTTTIKYYLTKQNFKEVRKIFCTWTNTDYESIKNDLTADELFKMRSKFFQAVTNHLAETQKTLDNIIQDKDDELTKRVIKSLIDKIHSLKKDSDRFDELTDYDDPVFRQVKEA